MVGQGVEVPVLGAVLDAVAVGIDHRRYRPVQDFPAVVEQVAVGVVVARVGQVKQLVEVGELIAVGIGGAVGHQWIELVVAFPAVRHLVTVGVAIGRIGAGEVFMDVRESVTVLVVGQDVVELLRIEVETDLVAVRHLVVVGIRVERLGVVDVLLEVGKAIRIRILAAIVNQRIEAIVDFPDVRGAVAVGVDLDEVRHFVIGKRDRDTRPERGTLGDGVEVVAQGEVLGAVLALVRRHLGAPLAVIHAEVGTEACLRAGERHITQRTDKRRRARLAPQTNFVDVADKAFDLVRRRHVVRRADRQVALAKQRCDADEQRRLGDAVDIEPELTVQQVEYTGEVMPLGIAESGAREDLDIVGRDGHRPVDRRVLDIRPAVSQAQLVVDRAGGIIRAQLADDDTCAGGSRGLDPGLDGERFELVPGAALDRQVVSGSELGAAFHQRTERRVRVETCEQLVEVIEAVVITVPQQRIGIVDIDFETVLQAVTVRIERHRRGVVGQFNDLTDIGDLGDGAGQELVIGDRHGIRRHPADSPERPVCPVTHRASGKFALLTIEIIAGIGAVDVDIDEENLAHIGRIRRRFFGFEVLRQVRNVPYIADGVIDRQARQRPFAVDPEELLDIGQAVEVEVFVGVTLAVAVGVGIVRVEIELTAGDVLEDDRVLAEQQLEPVRQTVTVVVEQRLGTGIEDVTGDHTGMAPVEQPIEAVGEIFETADTGSLVTGNAVCTAVIEGVVGKQARQQGLRDGDGLIIDLFVARSENAFIRIDDLTGATAAGNVIGFTAFDNCLVIRVIARIVAFSRIVAFGRIAGFAADIVNGAGRRITLLVVSAGLGAGGFLDELEGGHAPAFVDPGQFFCIHHALPDGDLVELAAVQVSDLPEGVVPGATDIEIAGTGHGVAERHADFRLTVKALTIRDEQVQGHVELAQVEADRDHRELAADQAALRGDRDQHVGHLRVILEGDPVVVFEIEAVGIEIIRTDMLLEQRHARVVLVVRVDP